MLRYFTNNSSSLFYHRAQPPPVEPSTVSFRPSWKTAQPTSSGKKSTEVNTPPSKLQAVEVSATVPTYILRRDQRYGETSGVSSTARLPENGWREKHYESKFKIDLKDLEESRTRVAYNYARGLRWILQYYCKGVPSWDWYVFY
jgi:5'-3' exonuclease